MRAACVAAVLGTLVSSASALNIDIVPVGNTGNANDIHGAGYGAVDYEYNIGRYEVTAEQYVEFLNAVAKTDTHGLYHGNMHNSLYGCQITRNGVSGAYTYDFSGRRTGTEADWAYRPVNFVGWGDAARFANWLHNGQPTGLQDTDTTEDGAYALNGATSYPDLLLIPRNGHATWVIPTENEWYKAAYHDPATGDYFNYPTASDTMPSNDLVEPEDPGNNATFLIGTDRTLDAPYFRTEVGAHEHSESPYGTFDQGGNVFEWNEAVITAGHARGARGGSFNSLNHQRMLASWRDYAPPWYEDYYIGFRVAKVIAPDTPGDTNNDHIVDLTDYVNLTAQFGGPPGAESADFNDDNFVGLDDFAIQRGNFGFGVVTAPDAESGVATPEPATLSLLALGGLALVRRRKRRACK
jgi:formylglycine-generating enzyme required for sulfatase activity